MHFKNRLSRAVKAVAQTSGRELFAIVSGGLIATTLGTALTGRVRTKAAFVGSLLASRVYRAIDAALTEDSPEGPGENEH